MHRPVRRGDRQMVEEREAWELLYRGEYGILSTVDQEGKPYGVPLNYACIDKAIYYHCALEGHKLDNIRANDIVSFCVVGFTQPIAEKFSTKYESVIVFGKIVEVNDEEEKTEGLLALVKKYSKDYVEEGKKYIDREQARTKVLKLDIEHITGKIRMS